MQKLLLLLNILFSFFALSIYANTKVLRLYALGGSTEILAIKKIISNFMKENKDIKVNLIKAPPANMGNSMYGYYLQIFESRSGDIDIVSLDTSWVSLFSDHLLDLTKYLSSDIAEDCFPNVLDSYKINSKIKALPWYTDVYVVYYRKDLLSKYNIIPPNTWEELTVAAKTIQDNERAAGNKDFYGLIWTGNASEGLACIALAWIYSYGGGTIINKDKIITIDNINAVKALQMAASWVGTISPTGVLSMEEEQANPVFLSENAAFYTNWPYFYSLTQNKEYSLNEKVGVIEMPIGIEGRRGNVLGGWGVAVNKYSRNKEEAAKLAKYLTSRKSQKLRAIIAGNPPTFMSLYFDKKVLKTNPHFPVVLKAIKNSVNRPFKQSAPYYSLVSRAFYNSVYKVLKHEVFPANEMILLALKLKSITEFEIKDKNLTTLSLHQKSDLQ